ncbi:ras and ef-hand domain-containing protein [Anaeramoeba flamelloides]|uniref:Ras and ef-hand domain-containing protein n=1 Tax=Anaeramoeba flamelloides TaxID=1746091 RepID=A0AAV7YPS5_9EUKA|nr:ras and ef-hand domain-containing protein [Anaeramoeba flamelloides]
MNEIPVRENITLKVVVVGNSSVGKTSILYRYTQGGIFHTEIDSTIGIDYRERSLKLQNKTFQLQIWDTAGQERFKTITRSYYRNSDGIIVVYDVSSRDSFIKVREWVESVTESAPENVVMLLIGNKIDLTNKRCVTLEEGQDLAKKLGIKFIETSAKTGVNIEMGFEFLVKTINNQKESKKTKKNKKKNNKKIMITSEQEIGNHKNCC